MATRSELPAEEAYAAELRYWRERRGLSKQALADQMAYDRSYVSHIEGGNQRPTEGFTRRAEDVLDTGGALWSRWDALNTNRAETTKPEPGAPERELRTVEFVKWIANHSDRSFHDLYTAVADRAGRYEQESPVARHARDHNQSSLDRATLTAALADYYDIDQASGRFYTATIEGNAITLSLIVEPGWADTIVELGTENEHIRFEPDPGQPPALNDLLCDAAIDRLARVEVDNTVMVNSPIYRMLDIELEARRLDATFALTDFASFALTSDLMEAELVDAVAGHGTDLAKAGRTPIRDQELPNLDAARSPQLRHCGGGPAALVAIARPADGARPADYLLLIQERSGAVLNAAGKLAVIPKAFHQPTGEPARQANLSTTLIREFEEELLGRHDLEGLTAQSWRKADTSHDHHRSEAMAWLIERQGDAFRTECVGFGFNLTSGTYEFPCLIVIDDETWWKRWGHLVEANWETHRIHRYSSLDTTGLAALAHDPRWSNEGLHAYLQSLQRLADLDTTGRVAAPHIRTKDTP